MIHQWQIERDEDGAPMFVHAAGCPSFCDYACGGVQVDGEAGLAKLAVDLVEQCSSCAEQVGSEGECPNSHRVCGHHCNHIWNQDACDWCDAHINDDGDLVPATTAKQPASKS